MHSVKVHLLSRDEFSFRFPDSLQGNDLFLRLSHEIEADTTCLSPPSDAPLCKVGGICSSLLSQTDRGPPWRQRAVAQVVTERERERERERGENGWTESPRVEIPLSFFLFFKLSLANVCTLLKGFASCEGSKIDLILKEREG